MGANDTISLMLQLAARIEGDEGIRESTRLPIRAKARILTNSDIIEGEVENLSMNGAYVTSDKHVGINSSVVITIFDDSTTSSAVFDIKATVVWVIGNRIGLQFA
jgi:hypothetical protein